MVKRRNGHIHESMAAIARVKMVLYLHPQPIYLIWMSHIQHEVVTPALSFYHDALLFLVSPHQKSGLIASKQWFGQLTYHVEVGVGFDLSS